jgi:hypothetical protein
VIALFLLELCHLVLESEYLTPLLSYLPKLTPVTLSLLVPSWFTHLFDGVENPNAGLRGFMDSITIVLSTPFLIAGLVAVILNTILPHEQPQGENIVIHDRDPEAQQVDPTTEERTSSHDEIEKDIKPAKQID